MWNCSGWQLGEHGEWCKHTNFELATHAPMMIRVPGATDKGIRSMAYTEHVDLFPTLAELAAGVTIPPCPSGPSQLTTALCTMGKSLAPIVHGTSREVAVASFSQYPRYYVPPNASSASVHAAQVAQDNGRLSAGKSVSACLNGNCTMGYSVITFLHGTEYRYTEWCDFNTKHHRAPDYERNVGTELYIVTAAGENKNIAHVPSLAPVVAELSAMLRRGPLTGGGWGPYSEGGLQQEVN